MEQSHDDSVCVINIKVCPKELKEVLSQVKGVFDVMYDPTAKLATIKGRFDPLILMNTINKLGMKAELISYNKHSHVDHQVHSTAPHPYKDKGKTKVGLEKKNQGCSRHDDSYNDGDSDETEEFLSDNNKNHKPEASVLPPKGVDEAICRDHFCRIHKRHGSINHEHVTKEAREKASSMFWQMPHLYQGVYGRSEAGHPRYHQSMFPPEYGFYQPTLPMSGINDPNSYLYNENPSKCNTM